MATLPTCTPSPTPAPSTPPPVRHLQRPTLLSELDHLGYLSGRDTSPSAQIIAPHTSLLCCPFPKSPATYLTGLDSIVNPTRRTRRNTPIDPSSPQSPSFYETPGDLIEPLDLNEYLPDISDLSSLTPSSESSTLATHPTSSSVSAIPSPAPAPAPTSTSQSPTTMTTPDSLPTHSTFVHVTHSNVPTVQVMSKPSLPLPGERGTPKFDKSQPRTLGRFFTELNILFDRSGTTDAQKQKEAACRYVDIDEANLWMSLTEFNPPDTFAAFKAAVITLYPGSDGERLYSVTDLDCIVGARTCLGIQNLANLAEYYCKFYAVSSFLIKKQRISKTEQCRTFRRGIPDPLWTRIQHRLEIKLPDHLYDETPYPLDEMHKAAKFVLHGTTQTLTPHADPATLPTQAATSLTIKTEDLSSIVKTLAKSITKAFVPSSNIPSSMTTAPQGPTFTSCHYCGDPACYIGSCPRVEEDTLAGLCQRNAEGKVILPGGGFVARTMPGATMRERINGWHRCNPGQ
ncbi:hypothetical protein A0H81_03899 [Grifola frondosa]|uniref:Uncharacterized protein n=1 Tax=Grifola frondosa TaxID=5627 RepID=A0A1C7MJ55_GRIFR|nr:hypothetical protein A0H81_03899 [Grifola frondosa]